MRGRSKPADGMMAVGEMREFAGFSRKAQRYIRRSLDVGLGRGEPLAIWPRDIVEEASIRAQARVYARLDGLRANVPEDSGLDGLEPFMAPLVTITAFDLGQARLDSFAAYRFLYERLLGAPVRPWLPAAFCAAASLPQLHPTLRKSLLQSLSEAAATAPGWSSREPGFVPEWVEKVELNA